MYREVFHQISFSDFNQSCGMQLDINNEWVILADSIKWGKWEKKYAKKFKSTKGNPAKPVSNLSAVHSKKIRSYGKTGSGARV